jgi:hypothetical protein
MISRSVVRGRNFTKRSSFFTIGLRRRGFVPKGQPEISPAQRAGMIATNKIRPEGTVEVFAPFHCPLRDKFILSTNTSHFVAG